MLSSRRLQVMVLVLTVSVLTVGFMSTGNFVQDATASGSECDQAMKECGRAQIKEIITCLLEGSNSKLCIQAKGRVVSKCLQAVIICEN